MFKRAGFVIWLICAAEFLEQISARFCDGGWKCSPPKECCDQGCCYISVFSSANFPRTPTPPTDHVLNLFFINHWYFWCFVFAIVLALLCLCSLWRKRRQLCGWGSPRPHLHSEGDSTGSCYAPPQYSRCNSFHHAPPPYCEVTSKPDLYPLVFSYTGNGSKGGGTNYLMVQYFRNYIVRPVGSLSAASTVDSLSSSFIRTANEANTLVPPPYSRATSPDLSEPIHTYGIPRSTSHQGGTLDNTTSIYRPHSVPDANLTTSMRLSSAVTGQNLFTADSMEFHQHQQHASVVPYSTQIDLSRFEPPQPVEAEPDAMPHDDHSAIYNSASSIIVDVAAEGTDSNSAATDAETGGKSGHHRLRKMLRMQRDRKGASMSFGSKESQNARGGFNTDSSVSSLANLGSQESPPRATTPSSPSVEVREILEQIRQIQFEADSAFFDSLDDVADEREKLTEAVVEVKRCTPPPQPPQVQIVPMIRRKPPTGAKHSRNMYLPISNQKPLRTSLTSNCILNRGRTARGWISKSAPSTPGTTLPSNAMEDSSPLLDEHDEDAEQNV